MQFEYNKSLKNYNTFGIDVRARSFLEIIAIDQLKTILLEEKKESLFILGGGSNMLLINNIDAIVLHINLKGITIISETESHVIIEAKAGENWHDFVLFCVDNNYGGIENLSLIPGNVGTAPIQNIGAYGVELKDIFVSCNVISKETLEIDTLLTEDCKFGYRDSIFKNEAKESYIITSVRFKLTKKNHAQNISYGAIKEKLSINNILKPSIKNISDAIIAIRKSKLPDPNEIGNSGSFFKNPILNKMSFSTLKNKYPDIPHYILSEDEIKIPAGWLIEKTGYKGKRFGDAGVHKNQALVLVNYGNATGKEIWNLALKIKAAVKDMFNIVIETEVNIF